MKSNVEAIILLTILVGCLTMGLVLMHNIQAINFSQIIGGAQ